MPFFTQFLARLASANRVTEMYQLQRIPYKVRSEIEIDTVNRSFRIDTKMFANSTEPYSPYNPLKMRNFHVQAAY